MNEQPARKLRKALGMTQQQFANALQMSIASVQGYDSGRQLSDSAIEKMMNLAVTKGRADIAAELRNFGVKVIYEPPSPGTPARGKIRLPKGGVGRNLADELHDGLDFILNSGDAEATAVLDVLLHFIQDRVGSTIKSKK